jgi:Domain of unknown function (DUF4492)
MNSLTHFFTLFSRLYSDGFRNMSSWGRKVWLIIIIKLFIIFVILKIFFFTDFLGRKYNNDVQKSEYVRNQILNPIYKND